MAVNRRVYGSPGVSQIPTVRSRDFRTSQQTDFLSQSRRYNPRPDVAVSADPQAELYSTFSGLSGHAFGAGEGEDLTSEMKMLAEAAVVPIDNPELAPGQVEDVEAGEVKIPELTSEAIRGQALNYGVWAGATPEVKASREFSEITRTAESWVAQDNAPPSLEESVAETVYHSREAASLLRQGGRISGAELMNQLQAQESGATCPAGGPKAAPSRLKLQDVLLGAAVLYLILGKK